MLQGEHSAILSTFIQLPFVTKIFVLSIVEWQLKTGFTVYSENHLYIHYLCHVNTPHEVCSILILIINDISYLMCDVNEIVTIIVLHCSCLVKCDTANR